jgi:Zn finger protein HypA/HybF involved in hydrogenase expression
MTRRDWERRLPEGVRIEGRDHASFTLGVELPTSGDDLWLMRCPAHPKEHVFKIRVTQGEDGEGSSDLYCPYCGHHERDVWPFAPGQQARLEAAAQAAAEQYVAAELDAMLGKALGGRSRASSRRSAISVQLTYKPAKPPSRRVLPTFEVEETRRTMQCGACNERFAVYGLALYCPSCGQLAPTQQFSELVRVQRERLAAMDTFPAELKQALKESGALSSTQESTIKDGLTALETYLKARFIADAPAVSLKGKGNVFQRLNEAAELYRDHLGVDLPSLVGPAGWSDLLRVAAIRHVLVHNAGIVDDRFLAIQRGWPQHVGQRIQVSTDDTDRFLEILEGLAVAVAPA